MQNGSTKTHQESSETGSRPQTELRPTSETRLRAATRAPKAVRFELDDTEVARLVLEATVAINTVRRWAAGRRVRRTTSLRLEKAVQKLGIARRPRPARAAAA